jgi:prevent-host-death family protein
MNTKENAMIRIAVEDINQNFSQFLERIETGESVVILKSGKPIAKMMPYGKTAGQIRPFGLCKGEFSVPDNFDETLPEQIIEEFEGL